MEYHLELVAGLIAAFVMTIIAVPWLIPKLRQRGVVGRDLNKPNRPLIPEMGGIAVVIGFFAGISVVLTLDGIANKELLYVSLSAILGAAFVGILDDIFELRQRQKAFFPFLLALPLGAALNPTIFIPWIGEVDFGVLMIVFAPFAVTCAANAGNMLEGFNGLGVGLGMIMSGSLIVLALHHNRLDGIFVLAPLLGALMAFLLFNKYPATVFPGDTLMLFMGAAIAIGGMLSNLYLQTTIVFIPMIIEFLLKLRGDFKAENYCSNASNGHLEYHGGIESLTHVLMKHGKFTENRLVGALWSIEFAIAFCVIVLDLMI